MQFEFDLNDTPNTEQPITQPGWVEREIKCNPFLKNGSGDWYERRPYESEKRWLERMLGDRPFDRPKE